MLTLDKVFQAQMVLRGIIRETSVVRAYGIAANCEGIAVRPFGGGVSGSPLSFLQAKKFE